MPLIASDHIRSTRTSGQIRNAELPASLRQPQSAHEQHILGCPLYKLTKVGTLGVRKHTAEKAVSPKEPHRAIQRASIDSEDLRCQISVPGGKHGK